jgi:hypothetical protein
MLRWIAERESHFAHIWAFIESGYERADLRTTINTFTGAEVEHSDRVLRDLLRHWTGSHGGYVTDATLEAVMVESVRRVVAQRDGSSGACA